MWRALVLHAAEQLQLAPPTRLPDCFRRAGLLPPAPSARAGRQQVDEFPYRLYGLYVVLTARYAHTHSREPWHGEALFPRRPPLGGRGGYLW